MFRPYQRYADFEGRSTRSEYWLFCLFVLIAEVVLLLLSAAAPSLGMLLLLIFVLGSFIPSLAVSVRRMHDTDRSGWNLLLSLIPFIGGIIVIVFCCLPSTPGDNNYGPPDTGEGSYRAARADQLDQLEQLGRLHASNVLTDEEFTARKAQILGG